MSRFGVVFHLPRISTQNPANPLAKNTWLVRRRIRAGRREHDGLDRGPETQAVEGERFQTGAMLAALDVEDGLVGQHPRLGEGA